MRISKNKILTIILLAINALLAVFVVFNVTYSIVRSSYIVQDAGMFTETVTYEGETHTYKCYRIKDEETKIAIAWGEEPNSVTGTLQVPSIIPSNKPTGALVDYQVVAIAKGGFSRCTFTGIQVPQTVTEIKEGAFSYCRQLTSFQFPKEIDEIAPSTFLDCRSLTSVYYTDNAGERTLSGGKIKRIGDHAFDSCVSLEKMQCPEAAVFFGKSCFQNCVKLNEFRFPYDNTKPSGEGRNEITVEEYAFEGCKDLHYVFFDVNMVSIAPYAFADSYTFLTFRYCGIVDSTIPRDDVATFDAANPHWRNKYLNGGASYSGELYHIIANEKPVAESGTYPGLYYYLTTEDMPLDNARTDVTDNTTSIDIIKNSPKYAVIDHFEIPDETDEDYYTETDGEGFLTIPDYITVEGENYYVKVIRPNAFSTTVHDLANLKEIKFNKHLVQIQNHAFYHSNQIRKLDFSECTDLREISYALFNEVEVKSGYDKNNVIYDGNKEVDSNETKKHTNSAMKSITLPNCLEYIGNLAFFNFTDLYQGIKFKTDESAASHLKIIGDYAFAVFRDLQNSYTPTGTEVDLILPNSLDDAYAPLANIYHTYAWDRKGNGASTSPYATVHASIAQRTAVNMNAFECQHVIRTVKMEDATAFGGTAHDTSFGQSIFIRSKNVIRFESNSNLYIVGTDMFKENTELREVFLDSTRAVEVNTLHMNYPWCPNDKTDAFRNGLFTTKVYEHLVVYVKGSSPNAKWNVETTNSYVNELETNSSRSTVPTHYVDWTVEGNVKYWHKNTSTSTLTNTGPKTLAEYKNGYISFVKNSRGNYTVAGSFTDGGSSHLPTKSIVNLTDSVLSSLTIDEIGPGAFGSEKVNKGKFFILPSTVIAIRNRAFYRKTNNQGVCVVTFANGANIRKHGANQDLTTFEGSVSSISDSTGGYCCLPLATTVIERSAFYNNHFATVDLGSSIMTIGNAAFYTHNNTNNINTGFYLEDYDDAQANPTSNTYYTIIDDAIYYTKEATKKSLLHFPNGKTTLTVASGTKAIAFRAAAGSKITSVTFDSDTTFIYGQAFKNCTSLTTLNGVSNIKYINAFPTITADDILGREITDGSNLIFDSYDSLASTDTTTQNKNARSGAFQSCSNLNFKPGDFTSLIKVGRDAFNGCSKLMNYTLPKTYKFFTGDDTGTSDTRTTNVMDLSGMSTLRTLESGAFTSCNIAYAITPNTTGSDYSAQSLLRYGNDDKSGNSAGHVFTNNSTKVLFGETAYQADQKGTSSLKPTTHYPTGAYNLSYTYFRAHSADDLLSATWETRRYWTAVTTSETDTVRIILFENRTAAATWFSNSTNVARQLHSF